MEYNIQNEIKRYLQEYPPALEVFNNLLEIGDVYAIGGLPREYMDNGAIKTLRDADFSIYIKDQSLWDKLLNKIPHKINQFGGHKFQCKEFFVDIWDVKNTWAFKNNIIRITDQKYFENLSQSVFLNMDAIVYDITNNRWNKSIYEDAMERKVLDIVLKENPFVELNILRAMILRRKYEMVYADTLKNIICEYSKNNDDFAEKIMNIQKKRYKNNVLEKEMVQEEIFMCM